MVKIAHSISRIESLHSIEEAQVYGRRGRRSMPFICTSIPSRSDTCRWKSAVRVRERRATATDQTWPSSERGMLARAKRMMGLEPTTFCMASRRSSQLSYIRAEAILAADTVERVVHEPVGELVVLTADGGEDDLWKPPRQALRLGLQLRERRVLDLVLAAHLLHDELRVGHDLELVESQLDRFCEPGHEGAVLGHVVRRDADRLAARVEHRPIFGLEHVAVRRGAGVAARAPVGGELRLHSSG